MGVKSLAFFKDFRRWRAYSFWRRLLHVEKRRSATRTLSLNPTLAPM